MTGASEGSAVAAPVERGSRNLLLRTAAAFVLVPGAVAADADVPFDDDVVGS